VALGDGVSCSSNFQKLFNFLMPALIADFRFSPQASCFPAKIEITQNLSTGDLFEWEVRDHTNRQIGTSNAANPIFNIVNPGEYTIYHKTTNSITLQEARAENSGSTSPPPNTTVVGTPVIIYDNPFAGFQARPTPVFVPDTRLDVFNRSSTALDPVTGEEYPIYYKWYFGDGTDTLVSDINPNPLVAESNFQPSHFYQNEGNYDIALIAINDHYGNAIPPNLIASCRDTTTQRIQAKAAGFTRVPNAFTPSPNGPGAGNGGSTSTNDVFLPIAKGIVEFQMQIYDRWGNLVFESLDKTKGWDGYDKDNNLLPAGVYVYKLVLLLSNEQRTTQIGDVTLIR
jgi:gliding motility-associated-like protein